MRQLKVSVSYCLAILSVIMILAGCDVDLDVNDAIDKIENTLADAGIDDIDDLENIRVDADFTMVHTRFDMATGQFVELTPPAARRNLTRVFAIGTTLYHLGGVDEAGYYTGAFEAYDTVTNTWSTLANRPNPGLSYDMVVGDQICGIGGFENLDKPIRKEVDCYEPATDTWSDRAPIPSDYAGFYPEAYEGKVYVFGGLNASLTPIDEAWQYDPVTDQWSALATLPFGFSVGGVVPLDGKIYLVGGYKGTVDKDNLDDQAKATDMLIYDIDTDTWSTASDMPHARFLYGAAPFEGHVSVFFGISDGPLVEFFDPTTGTWTAGTNPETMPDSGAYTRPLDTNELYLFTLASDIDTSSVSSSGRLWRYSIADDSWDMVGKRSDDELDALFSGVQIGDSIHFVGANTTVGLVNTNR